MNENRDRIGLAPAHSHAFLNQPVVTSLDDPRLEPLRRLQHRQARDESSSFTIEGLRFLKMALDKSLPIDLIAYAPADLRHPLTRALIADLMDRGVPSVVTTSEILIALANREDPQGVIAVTRQFNQPLVLSTPAAGLCWIAVDRVKTHGNLGTLLRTADCVGAAGLIMIGDDVDPYDPGCVRASMASILDQRLVRCEFDELREWSTRHRALLVGTSPRAKLDYHRAHYDRPVILYMGCERTGIDEDRLLECDMTVKIPMVGNSDSLNVGVAGSVLLYEIFNQRRRNLSLERGGDSRNRRYKR